MGSVVNGMNRDSSILIQASIGGLGVGAGTEVVFGELDMPSGVLLIDRAITLRAGDPEIRRANCAVVTNNPSFDDRDELFTEDQFRRAIEDYFSLAGRGLLVLEDAVARHNPQAKIEPDGLDERGRKFRLAPDITNGQVAVIVACWFAMRQAGVAGHLEQLGDSDDYTVITIGIPGIVPGASPDDEIQRFEMGGMLPIGTSGWPV